MKAISLWQPWATAIAVGAKTIETRHWWTSYRGPLAIHAAKRCVKYEMEEFQGDRYWLGALASVGFHANSEQLHTLIPFGAIVATCELLDCVRSDFFIVEQLRERRGAAPNDWCEEDMGNFSAGRYGWVLQNVKALPAPIPFKGAQGFFDVPDSLFDAAPAIASGPAAEPDFFLR